MDRPMRTRCFIGRVSQSAGLPSMSPAASLIILTAVAQTVTLASGTVMAPDSFGRLTISLTPSQGGGQCAGLHRGTNLIQRIESPSDMLDGTAWWCGSGVRASE
jgi:hypothetical protein